MTDVLTNGRLELGLARGAYLYEYDRIIPGMDAMEAGMRMREIVPTLEKLWQGDYSHQGKYFQFPSSTSIPKPLQKNGPPIWIAARDPNSHEFAVTNNWHVQVTPLWKGLEEITRLKNIFDDTCKKFPKNTNRLSMMLNHCYIGNNETEIEKGAIAVSKFYNNFGAWFKNSRKVVQGTLDPLTQEEIDNNEMYSPKEMRKNQNIGTLQEVIDNIIHQIKKERIGLESITNKKAKDILKKLGYNKYYEHIPFIKDKLGIKPPIMKQSLEETLCSLFMDIQKPYAKHCPDDRVNFLNYYYTLYKLCELLNQTEFLSYFPMLKDREKRIEQDYIWKQICGELKWTYIPTV